MNRLGDEQSPYLLQHLDNPVDWYAWGDAAFDAAREKDRPIFLSIGYSTCHWCHVMAHESFEDEAVARAMNAAFINVKVDREERPDVDQLYMTVCQMMTGSGGWPLTVVMTPDKRPFFATTYVPRQTRHGRLGMLDLVPRLQEAWIERRQEVEEAADNLTGLLIEAAGHPASAQGLDVDLLDLAFAHLQRRYDARFGGFGQAPKFPSPHNLVFLLRYWKRTGSEQALRMVDHTLRQMRLGGIYDHVGYGFHRYATDARWKLPHFEKMLYDQAMLALAYTEAFQATGETSFEATAREILAYVLRDLTAEEGGFHSAEDADSAGKEGTFYVWSLDELQEVLPDNLAELMVQVYNVEADGNFEEEATRRKTGENILYLAQPPDELAAALDLEPWVLREHLEEARGLLLAHRETRIRPGKDDKVLTDWNGLMIAALARAARVFGDAAYAEAARRAATFLLTDMRTDDGRLLHRYRRGDAALPGTLDDYAFLTWGLLELYETAFDVDHLSAAAALTDSAVQHFRDPEHGGFFLAAADVDDLIVRQKEAYDGALPSGNSVMMGNLFRLARMTGRTELEAWAEEIGHAFGEVVRRQPSGFTAMLTAVDFAVGPSMEVVVVGDPSAEDTREMLQALRTCYVPNRVVLLRPATQEAPAIDLLAPFVARQHAVDGQATAYVCRDFHCEQPTTDVDHMITLLTGNAKT